MSTSIDQAFIRDFEADVKHEFQRQGGILRQAVRTKNNVEGKSTTFQRVGKGEATTKSRHGVVPPMNQDHTPIECTLEDNFAGDWVDKLDEAKSNVDERRVVVLGGVWALGRKADAQIIDQLDATTQPVVNWTVSSQGAVRNSLLQMIEALFANDVNNDGRLYGALTPRAWSMAQTVPEFSDADFVGPDGLPFTEGAPVMRFKFWNGVLWTMHTGLPGAGTASAKVFTWHSDAIGHGSGQDIITDITWHGDRAAHFVNNMMSMGACLIDDPGVIEGSVDDTAAIPSS